MKKFANVFILGLAVILFTASCGSESTDNANFEIDNPAKVRAGAAQEADASQVTFMGKTISLKAADIMEAAMSEAENQDAADVMNINQTLMGAEKEAQLLDVNFSMADEPVDNGMFIFGIETEDAKDLTMQMYDEEGFGMVANNQFEINQGNNYKALNVNSLESGSYVFRLKDAEGKELQRTVEVSHK